MLALKDHGMPAHAVHAMTTALHRAEASHCAESQAWILRGGLDTAYRSMSSDLSETASVR